MSRVTLASISQGSGPGFGVVSVKISSVSMSAGLPKTPTLTCLGSSVPVVRLNWSRVSRQVRPPSWTLAGIAKPCSTSTSGLVKISAARKAGSPSAMILLGW